MLDERENRSKELINIRNFCLLKTFPPYIITSQIIYVYPSLLAKTWDNLRSALSLITMTKKELTKQSSLSTLVKMKRIKFTWLCRIYIYRGVKFRTVACHKKTCHWTTKRREVKLVNLDKRNHWKASILYLKKNVALWIWLWCRRLDMDSPYSWKRESQPVLVSKASPTVQIPCIFYETMFCNTQYAALNLLNQRKE